MKTYKVNFTVYEDKEQRVSSSDLTNIDQYVTANYSAQAQAMVESQYNGRAHVWSCYES